MQSYNAKLYPEPDRKDAVKMKEFFTVKYKQRRFAQKEDASDSEESDDSGKEKKKAKKKKSDEKKKKKKHASSSEEEEEDSDDDAKKKKKKKEGEIEQKGGASIGAGKLMAPPAKKGGLAKPEVKPAPVVQ